jgi:hypothetical protein
VRCLMKRIFALTLMGGLLLFGGVSTAVAAPARFKALFCPQCWEYLWGPDAVDKKGNCGVCGKYPVQLEAQQMSWWWCGGENRWRRAPCNENPMKRCCAQEEASTAVVEPGTGVLDRWYCPADRAFNVYRLPILMRVVCRTCARPSVEVNAMERAWYWCETDGVWAPKPCPMSPAKNCCSERKGLLVVYPNFGPIAN